MKSILWHKVGGAAIGIMILFLGGTQWIGCDLERSSPMAPQVESGVEHSSCSQPQTAATASSIPTDEVCESSE